MSKGRLAQEIHVVNAAAAITSCADLFNGDPATDIINLAKYDRCTFVLAKASGNTGTAVITVEACDDTSGTHTQAIPFKYWVCTSGDTFGSEQDATASGFTTTAGAGQVYLIEVNSSELYGTYKYVRLKMTEATDDPVHGYVVALLSGARYEQEIPPTAIT